MQPVGFNDELNECSIASLGRGMVGLAVTGARGAQPPGFDPGGPRISATDSRHRLCGCHDRLVAGWGSKRPQTGQLEGAGGIAVAADGSQVFVSGSLNSFGFPGLFFGNGFKALGRDPASGGLSDQGGFFQSGGGLLSPPLAVSPDAASFYWPLGGGPGSGSLASARRVAGGFALQGVVQQNLAGMVHALVVSADGKNVYLTNSMDDSLLAFQRDPSTGALTFQASFTDGIGGVDGLRGAAGLAISPDGEFVYVGGSQENPAEIGIFSRDTSTGALAFANVEAMPGFSSPGSIALSPNGQRLYAGQGGFVVFARDEADGSLAALPDSFVPSGFGFSFGAQTLLPVEDGVVYTLVASEHALWQVPTTSTGVDGAAATVYQGIPRDAHSEGSGGLARRRAYLCHRPRIGHHGGHGCRLRPRRGQRRPHLRICHEATAPPATTASTHSTPNLCPAPSVCSTAAASGGRLSSAASRRGLGQDTAAGRRTHAGTAREGELERGDSVQGTR